MVVRHKKITDGQRRHSGLFARSAARGTDGGRHDSSRLSPVSYTHLDVYKRQIYCGFGNSSWWPVIGES